MAQRSNPDDPAFLAFMRSIRMPCPAGQFARFRSDIQKR